MHYRRTPELSVEGTREVLEEIENGPRDTPERRAMLEHARAMRPHVLRLREKLRKRAPVEKS